MGSAVIATARSPSRLVGAGFSGLALFAALFFAGAGEPDPSCTGPPPPFWIKFLVGMFVGTFPMSVEET